MKKKLNNIFNSRNLVVSILIIMNCISFFTIFSVNFYPIFSTKFDEDINNKINDIYKNISYSLIGATMFYLIIDRLPNLVKKNRIKKVFSGNLIEIDNELNLMIDILNKKYFLKDTSNYILLLKEFEVITQKLLVSSVVVIDEKILNKKVNRTYISDVAFIIEVAENIKEKINTIYSNPLFGLLETEALILIHKIYSCDVFKLNLYYKEVDSNAFENAILPFDLNKELYKLYLLHLELRKMVLFSSKNYTKNNFKITDN